MAKNKAKLKIACLGVVALNAIAIVIFMALGGGEPLDDTGKVAEGFNGTLPDANVESVSDDRIAAARREDERRKREEMLGMTGSSFQLLEVEEKRKEKEENFDSLAQKIQEQTREDLERQMMSMQNPANVGNVPDTNMTQREKERLAVREKRRAEAYSKVQEMYGKEIFPDKEEKADNKKVEPKNEPVAQKEETPVKKKAGFNSLNTKGPQVAGNSVKAVVHGTHKNLTVNSPVKLRLLEPLKIGDVTIPRNSFIYGKVAFAESRLLINIDNVSYQNSVLPFKGEVVDAEDGNRGIYVPDNGVDEAMKESQAGAVSETPSINARGGSVSGLATRIAERTGGAIKNAVVKSVGKNKVSISENYMVKIRLREK